jgi:hypothetical protein
MGLTKHEFRGEIEENIEAQSQDKSGEGMGITQYLPKLVHCRG